MNLLDYLGPFLLMLGPLVVVHEFGHFAVAKWFGVKVERFSVGFGPAILRRRMGETEYVLAWLPLGGYVKMAGENPDEEVAEEDRARGFNAQSPAARIAIALAGPGMNMVLAVVVFACLFVTGFPTPTTLLGSILPDSPAQRAGLLPGDRITSVAGEELWRFVDLSDAVFASRGRPLALGVERGSETLTLTVTPEHSGGIYSIGVSPFAPSATVAIADPDSPAELAGLLTGDRIVALGGSELKSFEQFARAVRAASGPVEIEALRASGRDEQRLIVTVQGGAEGWTLERLGVAPLAFTFPKVEAGLPAERAGLRAGDVPLLLNGAPIASLEAFQRTVRASGGTALELRVARGSERIDFSLVPEPSEVVENGETVKVARIGVAIGFPRGVPAERRVYSVANPLLALWLGTSETVRLTGRILQGIRMLIMREVSLDNLAGPIGIGKLAGDAFRSSWFTFLFLMCGISINLAILNLLPIPVLDGGHIVFALTESVRGGPVGVRAREIAQTAGISFVILLMGFAFWNDLARSWDDILGWFKSLI